MNSNNVNSYMVPALPALGRVTTAVNFIFARKECSPYRASWLYEKNKDTLM